MSENLPGEDLDAAACQQELRELRATVALLRERLEEREDLARQRIDDESLAARQETTHLEQMIAALRAELEATRREQEVRIQEGCSSRDEEIRQLRETIALLRDRLEEAAPVVERAQRDQSASDLNRHLQSTVQKMRQQLEHLWAVHKAQLEERDQEHDRERRQLQETIEALRGELEAQHGRS